MHEPFRVLICDDSLGFSTLMRTWLVEDGRFDVIGRAGSGEQVRRMVSEQHPDLLVLDLVLPDVPDAAVLVRELREAHAGLRIMLISSLHPDLLEAAGAEVGADAVCNKGATAREITDRLHGVATAP